MVRFMVATCLAAAVCMLAITSALAGTVAVTGSITFVAAPGESNSLTDPWYPLGRPLVFTDSGAALIAGDGCLSLNEHSADCSVGYPHYSIPMEIFLGDESDHARVSTNRYLRILAGPGDDKVFADSFGSRTSVYGEEGNDNVTAAGEGGQIADGGNGDDHVYVAMPCGAGGGTAIGGAGDDYVRYRDCWDSYWSATTLVGGSGADLIESDAVSHASTADGGDGNDIVRILSGQTNNRGPFAITGGSGNDVLDAGDGPDTVAGGDGNDYLDVQGGGADVATCGAGRDIVLYDASDTVSDDCEIGSKDGRLAWFPPASGTQPFGLGSLGPRWR